MTKQVQEAKAGRFSRLIENAWYRPQLRGPLWLLVPFAGLFTLVAAIRRLLFRWGIKTSVRPPVPVVIVGNVSVGGTGKTPTVLGLVKLLQQAGYQPGIVSRGYGGSGPFPALVSAESNPQQCGDEPLMLAKLSGVPVAVAPQRAQAVALLLETNPVSIIISDDGLQHYALQRDLEIAVVDSARGLGNGWRLPVGPLRESGRRLRSVDWVVVNGAAPERVHSFGSQLALKREQSFHKMVAMQLQPTGWFRVMDQREIDTPTGEDALAIAGIGNPERFFNELTEQGIDLQETRVFPDHYQYQATDFYSVGNETPILMTEKDAVKCAPFARPHWYYLQVAARFSSHFETEFLARIGALHSHYQAPKPEQE